MAQHYSLNQILNLFDSTKDTDHDLRFMALSDLDKIVTESPQQFPNYNRTTLIYANILIKALDDQHSEVQNQAVKGFIALTPLLKTEDALKFIIELMSSEGDNTSLIVSSVYTMAVKTILSNLRVLNKEEGTMLVNNLLPKLLDYDLLLSKIDVIEILNDMIQNLGNHFSSDQVTQTYQSLIKVEFNAENTISKASITGLGRILNFIDERQLSAMLTLTNQEFVTNLKKYNDSDDEYYHIFSLRLALFTVFFKEGNVNVTPILPNVLEIVFQNLFADNLVGPSQTDEDDFDKKFKVDQVRDDALLCLEMITQTVGYEIISPYISQILAIANQILKYDPFNNFQDEGDGANGDGDLSAEDEDDEFEMSDNEEFDYEPEEEEENDYDLSWSLRKNAAKLIGRIAENYPLALKQIYGMKITDNLIERLSDTSVNASNEVIWSLTKIVSNTSKTGNYYTMTFYDLMSNNIKKRRSIETESPDEDVVMAEGVPGIDPFDCLKNSSELLCETVVSKLITEKFVPRFDSVSTLLSSLTEVLNGLPGNYLYKVIAKLNALSLKTSIDLLKFYSQLFKSNKLDQLGDQTSTLLGKIITSVDDSNYELSLEGLSTASEFFKAISVGTEQNLDHQQILHLGQIIAQKAISKSYSNDVKQRCLNSLAELIANYRLFNKEELSPLLSVYEQSAEYESLIEVSISNLSQIIPSVSTRFDDEVLERILAKFITLLNLRSQDLKVLTLDCLLTVSETSIQLATAVRTKIIETLVSLLSNQSLLGKQISQCLSIISNFTTTLDGPIFHNDDLMNIIDSIAPNIGNVDQESLLDFVFTVSANINDKSLFDAVSAKYQNINTKEFQAIYPGILASVALALNLSNIIQDSESYIDQSVQNLSEPPADLEYSVSFLGFVGRRSALSCGLEPFLKIVDVSEDTKLKTVTLAAIGSIAKFDVKTYLPVLLEHLTTNDLLSLSLRKLLEVKVHNLEIIPSAQGITDDDYQNIWNLILEMPTSKNDLKVHHGELNLIAECLTLIAVLNLSKIDRLLETIDSTTSLTLKYTIVCTIKYFLNFSTVLSAQSVEFDRYLSKLLEKASILVFQDNLQLKATAVQTLITSLHNKPLLALPILFQLLSTIMEKELVIRKEYIDTIQIGPFKHKIDNALDLRKSIYEMIYTLMTIIENSNSLKTTSVQQSLNYFDILKISIEKGLKDDNDVIQLSSLIIAKIVNLKPQLIFKDPALLTAFKDRALKIINRKMKDGDTKQVLEKQKESVKSTQTLISRIDAVIQKNGLQGGDFEEWRKFAFVNGIK